MDVNIDEIQNLQDLDVQQQQHQQQQFEQFGAKAKRAVAATKHKEYSSPQSNGSLSGADIIANCCAPRQSGNNSANGFLQDSYHVLSDLSHLTDFSISEGSHKNIEIELERDIEMELETVNGDDIDMETVHGVGVVLGGVDKMD